MLVRGALAGIDHNSNCGRGQAETKDGRTRLDLVKNRVGNKWFIRKVLVKKDHTWREDIAYLVIKVRTRFHYIVKYLFSQNINFRVWIQEEFLQ